MFEIYDINHDSVVSASSIGAVGIDWQVVGIAAYQSGSAAVASGNSMLDAVAPLSAGQFGDAVPAVEMPASRLTGGNATPMVTGSLLHHA